MSFYPTLFSIWSRYHPDFFPDLSWFFPGLSHLLVLSWSWVHSEFILSLSSLLVWIQYSKVKFIKKNYQTRDLVKLTQCVVFTGKLPLVPKIDPGQLVIINCAFPVKTPTCVFYMLRRVSSTFELQVVHSPKFRWSHNKH